MLEDVGNVRTPQQQSEQHQARPVASMLEDVGNVRTR
jgi:hypothetical protein